MKYLEKVSRDGWSFLLYLTNFTGVFAFLILKDDVKDDEKVIFANLEALVRKWIAAFAVPNIFLVSA